MNNTILTKEQFLNSDWYRIMYDPTRDRVVHIAKFSKGSDDILMTNTSNVKGNCLMFDNQVTAEEFAETLTEKKKAYYPFIVVNIKGTPALKRMVSGKTTRVVIFERQTRYGPALDILPLVDEIELTEYEKDVIKQRQEFLKNNDMRGFVNDIKRIDKLEEKHILQFFYTKGINVYDLI